MCMAWGTDLTTPTCARRFSPRVLQRYHKPGLVEGAEGKKNIDILSALYESAACGGEAKAPGCKTVKSKLGMKRANGE